MDSKYWPSGTDSSESNPPVPARRCKRKFATYEDSKQISNNLIAESVETNVIPPPRRKNKIKTTFESKHADLLLEGQSSSNVCEQVDKLNTYSDNIFTTGNDEESAIDRFFEIQGSLSCRVETLPPDLVQVQDILGKDKTLLNCDLSTIHSHLPLETFRSIPTSKNILESRVTNSSNENSATVIGVFLKTVYTPTKFETCEFVLNQAKSKQDTNLVQTSSGVLNNEWKPPANCSPFMACKPYEYNGTDIKDHENGGTTNEDCVKDVEENDSGVYFSDMKSSPHEEISLEKKTKSCELTNHIADSSEFMENKTNSGTRIDETFSSNIGDNIDNKHVDNMVSVNYNEALTRFEAETVEKFHMEIARCFSMNKEEISNSSEAEDALKGDVYLQRRCNTGLSTYLKSMLETDTVVHSVVPCPESADNDDRYKLDCCLHQFQEESLSTDSNNGMDSKSLSSPACTVVSSLRDVDNLSQVADSNVDFTVDINSVHIQSVNSYALCEIEQTSTNRINNVFATNDSNSNSKEVENTYHNKSFANELIETQSGNVLTANNVLNNEQSVVQYEKSSDLIMSNSFWAESYDSPPFIRRGVVSTLVAFFETGCTQKVSNNCDFDIEVDKESNSSILTSPDGIEELQCDKLTSAKFSGLDESSESYYDFKNMRENETELELPFSHVNESSRNELDEFNEFEEVSCNISKPAMLFESYCYSPPTVDLKDNIEYLSESIQSELNMISAQSWANPVNHQIAFESQHDDKTSLTETTDIPVFSEASKFEMDQVSSIHVTENSQKNYECLINYAFCKEVDDKDTFVYTSSENQCPHMNADDDVCDGINNLNSFKKFVRPKIQDANENSCKASSFSNETSLHLHTALTSSKTNILSKDEDIIKPINQDLNLTALDLSKQLTKVQFVLPETEVVFSPKVSVKFSSLEDISMDENGSEKDYSSSTDEREVGDSRASNIGLVMMQSGSSNEDEFKNTLCVILEKNWGSLGIKLMGDEEGVSVNDVLPGGSADCSELVFQGMWHR